MALCVDAELGDMGTLPGLNSLAAWAQLIVLALLVLGLAISLAIRVRREPETATSASPRTHF